MVEMFDGVSGEMLGRLTEAQLDELIDRLTDGTGEERFTITAETIAYLREVGVDGAITDLLAEGLGGSAQLLLEYHLVDETDISFGEDE
jgi:hypothetical protein